MKKYIKIGFTISLLLSLPFLLLNGGDAGEGIRQGLNLSYRSILPALFPAMVVCGIIGELSEYIPLPTPWTVWLTSHLCGFPMGIRTLTAVYQRGLLSKQQTIRLSACCVNASPAFLMVYAGNKILGDFHQGVRLFLAQLVISFLIGFLIGAFKITHSFPTKEKSLLSAIINSFSAAASGGLLLTGYIAFFSMVASLLKDLPAFDYLYGFLELTGGLRGNFYLAGAMAGFSGCSVLLQNAAYLKTADLPLLPMIVGKCLYMIGIPAIGFLLNLL